MICMKLPLEKASMFDQIFTKINTKLNNLPDNPLVKFLVVGVINTLLSVITIFSLKFFFSTSDIYANFTGYIVGLICSFILNRKWTFNHSGDLFKSIVKFILIFIVAYSINILFVLTLIKLNVNSYFSHLLGIPLYTIIFYLGSKFIVFKSQH